MEYNNIVLQASKERKLKNIQAFSGLSRAALKYGHAERKLLLYVTQNNEKIYIQFPGKETINSNENKIRPWDFRPKVEMADGSTMKDLLFSEIWDDLSLMNETDKDILAKLASIFFKMAFMAEHKLSQESYEYYDINIANDMIINHDVISFEWYKPSFDLLQLRNIEGIIGKIRGVSLEAYLVFNDLLAQNEDCKYYYKSVELDGKKWDYTSGRRNTLLSHISVIAYLQGHITFSQIMERFQKGMGVAPCKLSEIPEITNNIITKK